MEPQATKTETNELEGAKMLRRAAGDCRVALADLIGFFTLKLLSLIRSFVVMKISSDTTWIKHSKVLFKKLNRFLPKNPDLFLQTRSSVFHVSTVDLVWPPNINNDFKDHHFRNTVITETLYKKSGLNTFSFISLPSIFKHAMELREAVPFRQGAGRTRKISRPMVLAELEGESEWWRSKHKSALGVRRCRGGWRGRTEIRLVREAEKGQSGEKWRELISIDHHRQLHYQHLLDTQWIHNHFLLCVGGCVCVDPSVCLCGVEYITFQM